MRSGHIKLTSPNGFRGSTESIGVRVAAVRRVSLCALLPRIINAELNYANYTITPPPRLINNKYYISQDSIDFRVVLSLSCLRAFCLAQNVSSQAFWVAFGSVRCMLSLPLFISPIILSSKVSVVGGVFPNHDCDWMVVDVLILILGSSSNRSVRFQRRGS